MISKAISRFVRISPYKLRLLVDGIRGKSMDRAVDYLQSQPGVRSVAVFKVLHSAWANAKVQKPEIADYSNVKISLAKVDQGPSFKYSLPGAQGRSVVRKKRLSHIEIQLDLVEQKQEAKSE